VLLEDTKIKIYVPENKMTLSASQSSTFRRICRTCLILCAILRQSPVFHMDQEKEFSSYIWAIWYVNQWLTERGSFASFTFSKDGNYLVLLI
jgi:hypothetical protein